MNYNWQQKEWANFTYHRSVVEPLAEEFVRLTAEMEAVLQQLNSGRQQEELVRFMIDEAARTSEIEGEIISREDLMSSIKNKLGLNPTPRQVRDTRAKAITNLLITVRSAYADKLTESDMKNWHKLLFETSKTINAGNWRTGTEPMQVVSGAAGRETVHYEAPPSVLIPQEMRQFVNWYNNYHAANNVTDALIKTAVTHLYFESIHPFEDGNGRIGRAMAEKCLSQSLGFPVLLSLSSIIEKDKKTYYKELKKGQISMEVSDWVVYFSRIILQAQREAIATVRFSIKKKTFFDNHGNQLNERQQKVVEKMFDAGYEGFKGGMSAKKYMSIVRTSKATATRDLQYLTETGALISHSGGRSVYYTLNI